MKRAKKTVAVLKSGLMVQGMTAFGEMEWPMVMVDLCMLKVMFMKENGLKIRLMALVFTLITMEADTKDNGFRINNTATVSNNGQMVLNMKANMNKV